MLGRQPAGSGDAVKHRHVQVEEDGVGLVLGHKLKRLLPVRGGADHVDAGQPAEQQDEALADAGLVVGDHHAQRRRPVEPTDPADPAEPADPADPARYGHDVTSCGWSAQASAWSAEASGSSAVTVH